MKEAPQSVLHALFDAAMAVDGCMVTVFEHEHPEVAEALASWCQERDRMVDKCGFVVTARGGYHVIGIKDDTGVASISIHLNADDKRRAA